MICNVFAVCCSVLHCVALCCTVLPCGSAMQPAERVAPHLYEAVMPVVFESCKARIKKNWVRALPCQLT